MPQKKRYYQPDFHLLNRKAHLSEPSGGNSPAEKWFNRLLRRDQGEENEITEATQKKIDRKLTAIKGEINWEENLHQASYVAFDLETTGLRPWRNDEIIAVGAVRIESGQVLEEPVFYHLVNPNRSVPLQAAKITGLNDEILKGQPSIWPVLLKFLEFCGPRPLIAHNAPFDLAFLNYKLGEALGRRIVNPVIDTVLLTSALYYHLGDCSLENLAVRFDLDLTGRHEALADARIAASLYLKLLPALTEKKITDLPGLSRHLQDLDPTRGYPLLY